MISLVFMDRLPGMNEIIAAGRRNPYISARQKRDYQERLEWAFIHQTKDKIEGHCTAFITFYEPNNRRDDDNVIAGCKFILDALVKVGIIKDDSPKYLHLKAERKTEMNANEGNGWIEIDLVPDDEFVQKQG